MCRFGRRVRKGSDPRWTTPDAIVCLKANHWVNEGWHLPQGRGGVPKAAPLLLANCAQGAKGSVRKLQEAEPEAAVLVCAVGAPRYR